MSFISIELSCRPNETLIWLSLKRCKHTMIALLRLQAMKYHLCHLTLHTSSSTWISTVSQPSSNQPSNRTLPILFPSLYPFVPHASSWYFMVPTKGSISSRGNRADGNIQASLATWLKQNNSALQALHCILSPNMPCCVFSISLCPSFKMTSFQNDLKSFSIQLYTVYLCLVMFCVLYIVSWQHIKIQSNSIILANQSSPALITSRKHNKAVIQEFLLSISPHVKQSPSAPLVVPVVFHPAGSGGLLPGVVAQAAEEYPAHKKETTILGGKNQF